MRPLMLHTAIGLGDGCALSSTPTQSCGSGHSWPLDPKSAATRPAATICIGCRPKTCCGGRRRAGGCCSGSRQRRPGVADARVRDSPGFVPATELKPALDELPALYPTAEGFHDGTDGRRDRFTVDEWAGIDNFPFRSTELSLLAVSARVVDLAETLLTDGDLRISSAEAWAKYIGAADYDQPLHRDYLKIG